MPRMIDGPISTQEWLLMLMISFLGGLTVWLGQAPEWLWIFPIFMAVFATFGWIKDRKARR